MDRPALYRRSSPTLLLSSPPTAPSTPARDRDRDCTLPSERVATDRPTDRPGLLFYDIGRDCGAFVT